MFKKVFVLNTDSHLENMDTLPGRERRGLLGRAEQLLRRRRRLARHRLLPRKVLCVRGQRGANQVIDLNG